MFLLAMLLTLPLISGFVLPTTFQAPSVLTDQPEYNFGVVQLGAIIWKQIVITNPAPTNRRWEIHIRYGTEHEVSQM